MGKSIAQNLQEAVNEMLPDQNITMGLMEHQIDLLTMLIISLSENATLSDKDKQIVGYLKQLLPAISIDINNMDSPFESYKVPALLDGKRRTRIVQAQYLMAQARAGIL